MGHQASCALPSINTPEVEQARLAGEVKLSFGSVLSDRPSADLRPGKCTRLGMDSGVSCPTRRGRALWASEIPGLCLEIFAPRMSVSALPTWPPRGLGEGWRLLRDMLRPVLSYWVVRTTTFCSVPPVVDPRGKCRCLRFL